VKPPRRTVLDAKRIFDLGVSGVGIVLTSPLLAVIALLIRLDTAGPSIFRQERVGLDGRLFRIHKFRSMSVVHDGRPVSAFDDARVTRVGRFLRQSKLDELPQLIDVFTGQMSLVGPRPEVPKYVALWPAEARRQILSVRPGMTDPASIALRNEADELATIADKEKHYVEVLLPRKVAMYLDYVNTRGFTCDLKILARTLVVVVRG